MYQYNTRSKDKLFSCNANLQIIFNEVIKIINVSILCGYRPKEEQDKAYEQGFSKVKYPNSKHNKRPSDAVDAAPWPVDWKNRERFVYMAGIVKGIAHAKGIKIRWGGDWDGDNDLHDQKFVDLAHFEEVKE